MWSRFIDRVEAALAPFPIDWHAEVIDDSEDDTAALLRGLASRGAPLEVTHGMTAAGDGGLGGAVRSGLARARGEIVCVIDADLQHPPEILPELLAPIAAGPGRHLRRQPLPPRRIGRRPGKPLAPPRGARLGRRCALAVSGDPADQRSRQRSVRDAPRGARLGDPSPAWLAGSGGDPGAGKVAHGLRRSLPIRGHRRRGPSPWRDRRVRACARADLAVAVGSPARRLGTSIGPVSAASTAPGIAGGSRRCTWSFFGSSAGDDGRHLDDPSDPAS